MYFIVLGVFLFVLKIAAIGPVAEWPWWGVLAPFGAAVAWWWWADATGYTKRKEIEKMDARKAERRRKNLEALGMDHKGRRQKR